MWLFNSSIGRKVVMSLTGLFLILFVTFHVLMNAVALISPAGYNAVCEFLGANWYALIGTAVIAAGAVLHILYAFWLTYQNRKARGNDAYKITTRPKSVEWASKNMLVLGIIIVCFLGLHLWHFWAKMQLPEAMGEHLEKTGMGFVYDTFACPWVLPVYLVAFFALWFHLTHGFWSALHTLGTSNDKWLCRLKTISCAWATIVCLLFAVEVVVFTAKANCPDCMAKEACLLDNHAACAHQHGDCVKAEGACAHQHGDCCKEEGECAHQHGDCCKAEGECAHQHGECCKAEGECAHQHGECCKAEGTCAHQHGECAKAEGECCKGHQAE